MRLRRIMPILATSVHLISKVLTYPIIQKKKRNKGVWSRRKEIKPLLFADYIIITKSTD